MKRVLSWVVLDLISVVVSLITSLIIEISVYILGLIGQLNIFLQILIYIFGGATIISFIIAPMHYGAGFAVFACESIKPTRKGTRYIVFPVYMLIASVINIVLSLKNQTFSLNMVIVCIYYIMLIIYGKESVEEKEDKDLAEKKLISEYEKSTEMTKELMKSCYEDEEIENYAQYIIDKAIISVEYKDALDFSKLLHQYFVVGKEETLNRFYDFMKRFFEPFGGISPAAGIEISYFVGLLNANGVISSEELDEMTSEINASIKESITKLYKKE